MGQERPICDGRAVVASSSKAIESLVALSDARGPEAVPAAPAVDAFGIVSHRSHCRKIPTRASRSIQGVKPNFKG
jgi:hypothetical protein